MPTRTNPAQFAPKLGSASIEVEANSLKTLARPARLERATCGFEVRRSIQLSYGRAYLQFIISAVLEEIKPINQIP